MIDPAYFFKNISISMGLSDLKLTDYLLEKVIASELDLTPLITHTMKLDDIEEALELFINKPDEAIKIIIKP